MAFISSVKHNSGNEEVNIASGSTASINVSTASANIRVATISQDTACAYIASQSSGSQIKFEDINQINEDDMKEMDIKWNMALLSMRADRFWKRTGEEDKHPRNRRENHALIDDEETPTEFALMAKTRAKSEVFDNSLCSKACKKNSDSLNSKITELTDKLYDAKNMIYHYKLALAQVEARLAEHRNQELKYCKKIRVLEFKTESSTDCTKSLKKELELIKKEKEGLDSKLACFQTASKDLDSLLESQRLDKNKEGLEYSDVPSSPAQVYSPPKKDLSWTGLPDFKDDTVTDYSMPSYRKFVKANDSLTKSKTDKIKTANKPPVKYAEQYRKPTKKPNVRGNQRNWNNLKSHQLVRSQYRGPRVPPVSRKFSTVNRKFPTANRKFPTGGTKFSTADVGKKGKAVKASACWFWKPSQNLSNKGPNSNITHWFTLIVLSALRRSDNENMLSLVILILRSILMNLQYFRLILHPISCVFVELHILQPSTNNEDKVFNSGILIQENPFEVITRVAPDKNVKKIDISHASLILEDFDPLLYELPFHKEVPGTKTLLLLSFENQQKVFKLRILTAKGVHSSLLPELSH
uniref:Uncharacterized protein n=1 Tax=Tanacetum cinerariifolium TaxID=118510 RepID=A0A699J2K9_TANCI|nr:hypothetical protein [Tanacetum cinerariifolium]